jgi:predicted lysophospholipase L1 biosynthesis ABC-type transport system permease subunit
MGIPMRTGRDVSESDTMTSPFVAIVSESFVRRYWPNQNPLGRKFNFGNYDRQVIGVVGDVRVRGLERTSEPQVYLAYKQQDQVGLNYAPKDLVLHSSGDPSALLPALRRIVHQADPTQPVTDVWKLADLVEYETGTRRVQLAALGAFAMVAFLLAAIGIHGLLAFAVTNRTQEIGVRMALGAGARDILSMILGEGAMLAVIGIIAGSALAYAAGRGLQSLLAGIAPGDAMTFAASIALCLLMTIFGSLGPAIRAVRIDPTTAIRTE